MVFTRVCANIEQIVLGHLAHKIDYTYTDTQARPGTLLAAAVRQ